uniref:Putative amidohydrolase ytcJ n=1 Tax=Anthurium amnicola TaxID=1678845 RepID=A0A1D1ZJQ9_9ARAE
MGNNHIILSASAALLLSLLLLPALNTRWWSLRSSLVADLLVWNGTIFTSDPSLPFAEAMAVARGKILRVGNYSSLQEFVGSGTHELNLNGKVVLPGFVDSHVHFISGGLQMARVNLREARSPDIFLTKIKEAVKGKCEGDWILGGGWNNDFWGGEFPVASWIDEVTPKNPVWLSRMDGHMGLANSLALRIAGITNNTQDPIGGTVVRSTGGDPTGLLVDSAMKLLLPFIPEASLQERRDALIRASKYALMRGVTTVIDFGRFFPGASVDLVWQDFSDVFQWADSSGEMLVRVCLFFPMQTWPRLVDLVREKGIRFSQWIYLGGIKAFSDGSLGSNSALFYEPYIGEPHNYGLQVMDLDLLLNMTLFSDKSGLQVAIHAIGDKANDMMLDLFSKVGEQNGKRDRRFRIEHAQHLAAGSASRFGQLGVIASMQPEHLLDDAESAERKIGIDRACRESYLFQSLLRSGAQLAFGSDWPVADVNPLGGIRTATTRIPPGWKHAWIPSECVSLEDALKAYTISAAHASFLDSDLGSLSTGKLADFVVLSAGSWNEFTKDVPSSAVLITYVAGVQAYP